MEWMVEIPSLAADKEVAVRLGVLVERQRTFIWLRALAAGCRSHDLQLYHCVIENCATLDIFTYYIAKYIRISLFKIYTTVCQAVKHDCGHHPTKTRTSLYGILKILDRIFFKITIIYFKSS